MRDLADRLRTPRWAVLGAILLGLFVPAVNAASAQAAGPKWKLTVTPSATYFSPGTAADRDERADYLIEAENVGGEPTDGSQPIVVEDVLPAGLSGEAVRLWQTGLGMSSELAGLGACPATTECVYPSGPDAALLSPVPPHYKLIMLVKVGVPPGFAQGPLEDLARVSGGGAPAAQAVATNAVAASPPSAFTAFQAAAAAGPVSEAGALTPYTQAGGHPFQLTTEMDFATIAQHELTRPAEWGGQGGEEALPVRDPRDVAAELPPGLIGNPQRVPHCPLADFFARACPISDVVGDVGLRYSGNWHDGFDEIVALYNLQPSGHYPGELGYNADGVPFLVTVGLRSGSDYGLTVTGSGTEEVGLNRVRFNVWGEPAAPEHNALRGKKCLGGGPTGSEFGPGKTILWGGEFATSREGNELACASQVVGVGKSGPAGTPRVPFLTMPTECSGSPLSFGAASTNWQVPGELARAATSDPPLDGCEALKFEPTIEAGPTTDLADSPSGLRFDLHVPQDEEPEQEATPELREATVGLPAGLVVNPSSGAGLEGCAPAQIGLATPIGRTPAHFTEVPAECPAAAKIGLAEVETPLLHESLKGAVYLATPHQNPFDSLLAAYIVLEGEGLIIKLPGEIEADPQTGRLTGRFLEDPPTPFEDFHLEFFGGARGDLRTPAVCGTYETTSTLTPYSAPQSGPPAEPTSEFETVAGPTGGACPAAAAQEPHSPVFHAGTESTQAGAYTPFSLKLVRADGEQEITQIETTLPEGLVGRLAGTTYCPDAALAAAGHVSGLAEQQSPSCPSSSEVGTVDVAAGAGPTPLNVPGRAYLAGPYKGAPLSLAIITPAVAGPFDLGDVVVRTALYVDPLTTQITAKSDPIPTILEGIPLDVRQITLQMARPRFTLNPTDCEAKQITGTALTSLGASAALSQPFQVGNCPALGFRPSLKISLKGSTRHAGHPALRALVTYPKGGAYANIAAAQVNLPHSEFIDQGNLNKTCTRPVLLEGSCPATSIYGKAKAWTPLLDQPLEGPVYLVGGFGYKLPALVAELDGQIRVLLVGKVDSGKNHGIRNTFEAVPDAPVEKFELRMKGGKRYSLLENSEDLCRKPQKAIASFTAQNGKVLELHPTVANGCKKKGKKGHKKRHNGHKGHGKAGHRHARLGAPTGALAALLPRGW